MLLQCGRDSIPWVDVRKALLVLRQKTSILPPVIRGRLFAYARGLMTPPLASSEHLLLWTRNQKCTDPQDIIYGIRGLLDPRIIAKIEVDYSVLVWKTYLQLVLAEKEVYRKLNMLDHCSITTRSEGSLSWVPNWDQSIEGANTGYLSIRRFDASARSTAVAKLIEALKSPLEPAWKDALPVSRGWALSYFINAQTGELLKSDPRLGLLSTGKEEVTTLDPIFAAFRVQE